MDCAIVFDNLGPYHLARIRSVAERCRVVAIEISGRSREYRWSAENAPLPCDRITLFPKRNRREYACSTVATAMWRALRRYSPLSVAVAGWSDPGALAATLWSARHGRPCVLMSASHDPGRRAGDPREVWKRLLLNLYAGAVVGGRKQHRYLQKLGFPSDRIFSGYNCVDNAHFSAGAAAARQDRASVRARLRLPRHYFLTVCRFIPEKNLDGLLRAYRLYTSRAGERAWPLVVVGAGPLEPTLRHQAESLRVSKRVTFTGFVAYDDLPNVYGLASAFVLPSISETWGLVVNEAMACGLPVVVSESCGCSEDLVLSGVNGYTFDPHREDVLADLLFRLQHDDGKGQTMGEQSERMVRHWSAARFAESLVRASARARRGGNTS